MKIIHFIVFKLSSTLKWQKMPQKAVVSDAFLSVKVKMSGLVWRVGGGEERGGEWMSKFELIDV